MPISDKVMLPASFQENFPQALLTRLHSASAGCQANRLFYRHCLSLRTTVGLHIPSLYLFGEICQSKNGRAPKTGNAAAHILDRLGKVCYSVDVQGTDLSGLAQRKCGLYKRSKKPSLARVAVSVYL